MINEEKELEDCIFLVDEEKDSITTCCMQCYQDKLQNNGGMFWNGSTRGYGPWEIKCNYCNKIINEGTDADQ